MGAYLSKTVLGAGAYSGGGLIGEWGLIRSFTVFNIFINDIFSFLKFTEITNYADDNTPYICSDKLHDNIAGLEYDSEIIIKWIDNNLMKLNTCKSHVLMIANVNNTLINN